MAEIRVISAAQQSADTAQTAGMKRLAAVSPEIAGSSELWAGTAVMPPATRSGAHHHGDSESVVFVLAGRAVMRWGEHLENSAEAAAGDYIFIPAGLVHQEINPDETAPLQCIVVRSGGQNTVVNIESAEA